jgi:hypothetical protein
MHILQSGIAIDIFNQLLQQVATVRIQGFIILIFLCSFIVLLDGSFIVKDLNISFLGAAFIMLLLLSASLLTRFNDLLPRYNSLCLFIL